MKRIVVVFAVFFLLFLVGCGSKETDSNKENTSDVVNESETNSNSGIVNESETNSNSGIINESKLDNTSITEVERHPLTVKYLSDRKAEFTIQSEAFLNDFSQLSAEDFEDSDIVYSWEVDFDDYFVEACLKYENGFASIDLLECSIGYLERGSEEGHKCLWHISDINFTLNGDTLTMDVVLPNESSMGYIGSMDASKLAQYTFMDAKEYNFIEEYKRVPCADFLFDLEDVLVKVDENIIGPDTRAFPEIVYEQGFVHMDYDAKYIGQLTKNFIIYNYTCSINDDTERDTKLIVSFNDNGIITDVINRKEMINISETISWEESFDKYTLNEDGNLQKGEVAIEGRYSYIRLSKTDVATINRDIMRVGSLEATSPADCIQENNGLIDSAQYYGAFLDSTVLYQSDFDFSEEGNLIENYCEPSDFPYWDKIELMSNDYYIVQKIRDEGWHELMVNFFDEEGESLGVVLLRFWLTAEDYDTLKTDGFNEVEGVPDALIYIMGRGQARKTSCFFEFNLELATYDSSSYEQGINDYEKAFYMSVPKLY